MLSLEALPFALRPAWPDEGRGIIQTPLLQRAAGLRAPHGRCLNIGCGEGLFANFLESFAGVTEIVNVDIDPPSISARRGDSRHIDIVGSITAIPVADRSCDWVLCTEVIEHVEDDALAAGELARVLKPGGAALISVPQPPAPYDAAHVREGYTLQAMRELLFGAGFEVVAHWSCMRLITRWRNALWHWQYEKFGRNLMPRVVVRTTAHADRWVKLGRPYDLVVLAVLRSASSRPGVT
jgi:SAM-dependent methyltransferase